MFHNNISALFLKSKTLKSLHDIFAKVKKNTVPYNSSENIRNYLWPCPIDFSMIITLTQGETVISLVNHDREGIPDYNMFNS